MRSCRIQQWPLTAGGRDHARRLLAGAVHLLKGRHHSHPVLGKFDFSRDSRWFTSFFFCIQQTMQ